MRIHLKNVNPKVHGMITEHKATHNHENLDQTISCLIETAMFAMNIQDEYADNCDLVKFHIAQNDKMNAEIARLKAELERLTFAMVYLPNPK
jgi:citrate lyase beta subunit